MIIEMPDSFVTPLIKRKNLDENYMDCLRNLMQSFAEGHHYIHGGREFWGWLSSRGFLSANGKSLAISMQAQISQYGNLLDKIVPDIVNFYIRIVDFSEKIQFKYQEKHGLGFIVAEVGLLFFFKLSSVAKMHFVCENRNDKNYFYYYSWLFLYYKVTSKDSSFKSIGQSVDFDAFQSPRGNGSSIGDFFRDITEEDNKKIFGIVDSDRCAPDQKDIGWMSPYGDTYSKSGIAPFCCNERRFFLKDFCMKLNSVAKKHKAVCLVVVLNNFREAENSFHYKFLKTIISCLPNKTNLIGKINNIENHFSAISHDIDEFWRYLDLKEGLSIENARCAKHYWASVDNFLTQNGCGNTCTKKPCTCTSNLKLEKDILIDIIKEIKTLKTDINNILLDKPTNNKNSKNILIETIKIFKDLENGKMGDEWLEIINILKLLISCGFVIKNISWLKAI